MTTYLVDQGQGTTEVTRDNSIARRDYSNATKNTSKWQETTAVTWDYSKWQETTAMQQETTVHKLLQAMRDYMMTDNSKWQETWAVTREDSNTTRDDSNARRVNSHNKKLTWPMTRDDSSDKRQ